MRSKTATRTAKNDEGAPDREAPILRRIHHPPITLASGIHSNYPSPQGTPKARRAPRACVLSTPHCPTITPGLHSPWPGLPLAADPYPSSRPPGAPGIDEPPPPQLVLTFNVYLVWWRRGGVQRLERSALVSERAHSLHSGLWSCHRISAAGSGGPIGPITSSLGWG